MPGGIQNATTHDLLVMLLGEVGTPTYTVAQIANELLAREVPSDDEMELMRGGTRPTRPLNP